MFIKVESVADLNVFNQIWMECWLEKGYELEQCNLKADQFIIGDNQIRFGTMEFKEYRLDEQNNINKVYPFHQHPLIRSNPQNVVEIDRISILKEYRGKNLEKIINLYIAYTEQHQIHYSIGLMERMFYKAIRNVYKVPLEALGEKVYYKGDYVIPTLLYSREAYQNKQSFPWYEDIHLTPLILT